MIVWASQSFRLRYPDVVDKISSSIYRPYMTDDLIHTLLEILDIRTPEFDTSRSVINPLFNYRRLRVIAGKYYRKETDEDPIAERIDERLSKRRREYKRRKKRGNTEERRQLR